MARADVSEFIGKGGGIDWDKVAAKGFLVKKIEHEVGKNSKIELYDAQAALVQLGKHHRLFIERVEEMSTVEHHIIGLDSLLEKVYGNHGDGGTQ